MTPDELAALSALSARLRNVANNSNWEEYELRKIIKGWADELDAALATRVVPPLSMQPEVLRVLTARLNRAFEDLDWSEVEAVVDELDELDAALKALPENTDDGGVAETDRRHTADCRAQEIQRQREAEQLAASLVVPPQSNTEDVELSMSQKNDAEMWTGEWDSAQESHEANTVDRRIEARAAESLVHPDALRREKRRGPEDRRRCVVSEGAGESGRDRSNASNSQESPSLVSSLVVPQEAPIERRQMNQDFHDHLDICVQCRTHPLNLCHAGAKLLYQVAFGGDPVNVRVAPADAPQEKP